VLGCTEELHMQHFAFFGHAGRNQP
jgi:hypothetical protein